MMSAIADRLAPLFASDKIEAPAARQIALAAIDEYRPEAGIDFVNIARVLAFSMSAVELLRQALAQGVTLKDQMRMFGRANALNRSAEQSERTMMQRRKQHRTQAHAARGTLPPEPVLDPAAVEAAVAEAIAVHDELRAKTAPPPPAPEPAVKRDPTPTQPEPAIERDPTPTPPVPAINLNPPAQRMSAIHCAGPSCLNPPPLTVAQLRAAAMRKAAYIPASLLDGVGLVPNPPPPRP